MIRDLLLYNWDEFSSSEVELFLEIILDSLGKATLKTDERKWAANNGSYFAGNCLDDKTWAQKFNSCNFTLEDIIKYTNSFKENTSRTQIDFCLRNAEVVLRDDLRFYNEQVLRKVYTIRLENIFGK